MLLVDGAHERGRGRQDLVDKDEDGLLGRELDTLADHVHELSTAGGETDPVSTVVARPRGESPGCGEGLVGECVPVLL